MAEKWAGRPPVLSFRDDSRHVQKCQRQVYIKVFNDHTALVALFMVTSVQERYKDNRYNYCDVSIFLRSSDNRDHVRSFKIN